MTYNPRDPDAALVAVFKPHSMLNELASAAAGRPVHDDLEVVEIRFPGSRAVSVFPATAFSDWVNDPFTGAQTARTYAERFSHQYRQFKEHATQTKSGTPLAYVPFLTEGKRAELKAMNIYTLEALAEIEGEPLKNLGYGGRDLKNKAMEFIENSRKLAPNTQMQAELEALRARNQVLEEDNKAMAQRAAVELSGDEMLDDMSDAQLKDFIGSNTGARPQGNPARRTLLRMAMDARQPKAG
jgi:hypothetical protein